jgi:hypothetical protein
VERRPVGLAAEAGRSIVATTAATVRTGWSGGTNSSGHTGTNTI